MIQAYNLLKDVLSIVETNEKLKIFSHLFLSIIVSLLDLILYNTIALLGRESPINLGTNLSNTQFVITLIIVISLARLFLLYSTVITSATVARSLHLSLVFSYIRLPYKEFKSKEKAFYLNKLSKHIELAIMALFSSLQLFTNSLTIIISGLYILITADFKTILLIFFVALLFWMISIFAKLKLKKVSKNYEAGLNLMMINNLNIISSFREIFFMQSHIKEVKNIDKLVAKTYLSGNSIAFYSSFSRYFLEPIILIAALLFILKDKSLDLTFIKPAIIFSLLRITSVLQTLFSNWTNIIAYKEFVKSVSSDIKFIFKKNKIFNHKKENFIKFKYNKKDIISISNLFYGYKKNDYLINNLNINFKSGLNVLIGDNGCGKSTLLDIITGLVSPEKGIVLFEDIPMWNNSELSKRNIERRKDLLKFIAYVPQEAYIYNESILKNITGTNYIEDIDIELLDVLIDILGLQEISGNNLKLINRNCGENGNKLSGGQRQRLALARSLYKKPRYLFLDESLSAIDENSRMEILEEIQKLKFIKCIILVSHYFIKDNKNISKFLLSKKGIQSL